MSNPYQAPDYSSGPATSNDTATVIGGQKMLIYSILAYLCSAPIVVAANSFLGGTPEKPEVTLMFGLVLAIGLIGLIAAAIGACLGIFRMGRVLYPGTTRYIYAIGVLIPAPLIGLIVMLVANASATGYLKSKGISVGFFGAKT